MFFHLLLLRTDATSLITRLLLLKAASTPNGVFIEYWPLLYSHHQPLQPKALYLVLRFAHPPSIYSLSPPPVSFSFSCFLPFFPYILVAFLTFNFDLFVVLLVIIKQILKIECLLRIKFYLIYVLFNCHYYYYYIKE